MKKILIFSLLLTVVASSCKKTPGDPSITVTASFPTINFVNGNIYYTIAVGSPTPGASTVATAYDSFYRTNCTVVLIDSTVHTLVPGLYQATATAQNKYGYLSTATYYVAVTNLPNPAPNLTGAYQMGATDSFVNNVAPFVSGYYSMDNFGGGNVITGGPGTSALFAFINDSTIAFTDANFGVTGTVTYAPGDTSLIFNGLTYSKP